MLVLILTILGYIKEIVRARSLTVLHTSYGMHMTLYSYMVCKFLYYFVVSVEYQTHLGLRCTILSSV